MAFLYQLLIDNWSPIFDSLGAISLHVFRRRKRGHFVSPVVVFLTSADAASKEHADAARNWRFAFWALVSICHDCVVGTFTHLRERTTSGDVTPWGKRMRLSPFPPRGAGSTREQVLQARFCTSFLKEFALYYGQGVGGHAWLWFLYIEKNTK